MDETNVSASSLPASSVPSQPEGVMTSDELFSKAEQFFMGDNSVETPKTPADSATPIKLDKVVGENEDTAVAEEDDEDLPLYHYEGKVGNEIKNVEIKDKDQLDRYIQKGLLAEQVYKEYKNQQKIIEPLREKANAMDAMDNLMEQGKHSEVLDMITEDMPEEALLAWVQNLVDNRQKPPEVREFEKQRKEIERYKQDREFQEQSFKKMQQEKAEFAQKQEEAQLHTWATSEFSKYASKLPEEYKPWLNKQIQLVVANISKKLDNDNDLTLSDLSAELREQLKPVLSRTSPGKIKQELGKATESKKMDALTRLQNSASKSSVGMQKSKLAMAGESGNVSDMFDAFSDMII